MSKVAAMVLLAAAAPEKPQQFDLKCTGEYRPGVMDAYESITSEYRVDLVSGRYCTGECWTIQKIHSFDERYISFEHEGEDTLVSQKTILHGVSRQTGAWQKFYSRDIPTPFYSETRGVCEAAPFKGFPEAKAKF